MALLSFVNFAWRWRFGASAAQFSSLSSAVPLAFEKNCHFQHHFSKIRLYSNQMVGPFSKLTFLVTYSSSFWLTGTKNGSFYDQVQTIPLDSNRITGPFSRLTFLVTNSPSFWLDGTKNVSFLDQVQTISLNSNKKKWAIFKIDIFGHQLTIILVEWYQKCVIFGPGPNDSI